MNHAQKRGTRLSDCHALSAYAIQHQLMRAACASAIILRPNGVDSPFGIAILKPGMDKPWSMNDGFHGISLVIVDEAALSSRFYTGEEKAVPSLLLSRCGVTQLWHVCLMGLGAHFNQRKAYNFTPVARSVHAFRTIVVGFPTRCILRVAHLRLCVSSNDSQHACWDLVNL